MLASPACSCYTATTQDTQHREYVCVTLAAPRLQLWWKHARSRVLLSAYLFEDSAGATQALYVANLHLEGHPRCAGGWCRQQGCSSLCVGGERGAQSAECVFEDRQAEVCWLSMCPKHGRLHWLA